MTVPVWERRFRAPDVGFPTCAKDVAHRCFHRSTESGTGELYCWDRRADTRLRATNRPNGTSAGAITPDGEQLWWFADTDGDELGEWMRQPFGVAAEKALAEPAVPGLDPGWQRGLVLGRRIAVLGLSRRDGVTIYTYSYDGEPAVIYRSSDDVDAKALSEDEALVAIQYGDSMLPSVRVVRTDGRQVGTLSDLPEHGLHVVGFSPMPGDQRLLIQHERYGRRAQLLWTPGAGDPVELPIDLPGDLSARWYPDADNRSPHASARSLPQNKSSAVR